MKTKQPIRTRFIKISVDDEEYNHIKNNAQLSGEKIAVYARETLLKEVKKPKKKIKLPPPPIHKDLLYQLAQIGNNINQIARGINTDELNDIQQTLALNAIVEKLNAFERAYLDGLNREAFYVD